MPKIVTLADKKFPVGSQAWHPELGISTVLESKGYERRVQYALKGTPQLTFKTAQIPVSELRSIMTLYDQQKNSL